MSLTVVFSVLFLASASMAWATFESRVSYSANAFSLDGGELLYVERHVEIQREGRLAEREVRYEDASGKLIAEKLVRYGESALTPTFKMIDFRLGLREGAEVESGEVVLFSGPLEEPDRGRRVKRPRVAVIDAGFDAFVRDNFSEVVRGRSMVFDFAVPAVGRFLKFQLVPHGRVEHQGEEALSVTMRPANRLLRLLVDPIDLVYGLDGRLLEFRGLSNVWDEDGDRYLARIAFDYPDETAPSKASTMARNSAP
jgi:hypothetical protein